MDNRSDADIPFASGDDFPFVDRAVDAIVVAGIGSQASEADLLRLMLEGRRVLRVGGALRIVLERCGEEIRDGSIEAMAVRAAATAGLRPHPTTARVNPHIGVAFTAPAVLDFTKPDRQAVGQPLVSIVIPAYRPRFFAACLRSALAQTYEAGEILVCDDSGGEEIAAIVRDYDTRRRVRYVRNARRLRSRENYRQGFVLAQGDFIKFLNDDDALEPACVERLVDAFRRTPDVALATSYRRRLDGDDNVLPDQPATMPIVDDDTLIAGVSLANAMLMAGLNIVGEPSTVLFRKSDLSDGAPESFHFHGEEGRGVFDMTLWSTLLLKGDAVYLRDGLSAFRIHDDQQQNDSTTVARSITGIRGLQAAWLALGLNRRRQADMLVARPYPFGADDDWKPQRVRSFPRIDWFGAEPDRGMPVATGLNTAPT
jgi:glycosyltransferase involved in cell wall biosynthesis